MTDTQSQTFNHWIFDDPASEGRPMTRDELIPILDEKDAEIKRLREALRWYGDMLCAGRCEGGSSFEFDDCSGCRARAVLEHPTPPPQDVET